MKSIVVVGGGASGWITALYLNMSLKNVKISVIESNDIGILGAGEGSVPILVDMLDYLEIPILEIIKDCEATIKTGIKFTNWNGDNTSFYHNFYLDKFLTSDDQNLNLFGLSYPTINLFKNIDFIAKCSEEKKVPFVFNGQNDLNPTFNHKYLSLYSIHFNALKMANKLKSIGISRGINLIEGKIIDIELDDQENVKFLNLEDRRKIFCDFVFDCSGFGRIIIGKKYGIKWKSHSSQLPVNSAVPFFINIDEDIPPYTEAIAMKYGWIWKIPLQSRYGCGYVYDSGLATEEDIKKEIEVLLGYPPEYPRKDKGPFKFEAGYFEEPWTKNCIAVGLASGFIEPLEATSIWTTILSLKKILSGVEWLYVDNDKQKKEFNEYFKNINDQVVDFIYLHYMSTRKDTDFWKKFTYENASKKLKEKLDILEYRFLKYEDVKDEIWGLESWLFVAYGIGLIKKELYDLYSQYSKSYNKKLKIENDIKLMQDDIRQMCLYHKDFLNLF